MYVTPASPDNEAIRELRDSSKRLEKLMEKLCETTEKLSKSSNRLEIYTYRLIVFTMVLIVLTIALFIFPSEYPMWVKGIAIILSVVMVVKAYPLDKKE